MGFFDFGGFASCAQNDTVYRIFCSALPGFFAPQQVYLARRGFFSYNNAERQSGPVIGIIE